MHATRRGPAAVTGPSRSGPTAILWLGLLLPACAGGEPPRGDDDSAPAGAARLDATTGLDATAGLDATTGAAADSVPLELLPPLEGTEWVVEELYGAPPPQGARATLTLDGEARMVTGSGGCNRYTGAYELAGGRLTFGTMAGTRMACPAEVMAFEDAFMEALARVGAYRLIGTSLDLLGDAGSVVRLRGR